MSKPVTRTALIADMGTAPAIVKAKAIRTAARRAFGMLPG